MAFLQRLFPTELRDAFTIQKRVIAALVLREMITRYGRNNIGFLWIVAEPMMFTLGIVAFWSAMRGDSMSGLPVAAFAVTGYSAVLMWRNATSRCINAITSNLTLMYHRYVKVIDIFFARIILEVVGTTVSLVILSLFFYLLGWMEPPQDYLMALTGWMMLAWFGFALATIVGALTEKSALIGRLWGVASYLMFPLSGAMFMVDWLPARAQELALYIPMVHGTEMLRQGFFGDTVTTHYDLGYMTVTCLVLTFIGLTVLRETSKWVEPA